MGVFKQVWEVYKENRCELTLHRSITTQLGTGALGAADAAAVAAFVTEMEQFLRDADTFLLMLSVGLRGLFDTQSSFVGLLLREDVLQASLIDFMLEKLSEYASEMDNLANHALEKNIPKLILREIRWIDHVVDSSELVEKFITALSVFPIALQRDMIYILPEIAGDADAHNVINALLERIRDEAELVVCCIEALGNFNVVNEQTNDVVKCVLERLDSSPLADLPVIVKYLVQEAPGADVDLIASELREKLSATLSFPDTATQTSTSGRRTSTGSGGVDSTRNEEALVLGAIIQGFYFREDLLKAFLASSRGTNMCLLDMWVLFGAHSIPRDRQKLERLFKAKVVSGAITRGLLVRSIKGYANALKPYFSSTLQLAEHLIAQQNSWVCTEMGSLMFEVLFEEFWLCRKDGKSEAAYYQGEIVTSLLGFCLSAANETTDSAFKTLRAFVSPEVTFSSELRDRRYEQSHFKRRHRLGLFLPALKQLLDAMETITTDQIRLAYEILFAVGGPEDTELLNTIRKQNAHQEAHYRKCGIVGSVAQMNQLLLQHGEDAATRTDEDLSAPTNRKAAEAFTKLVTDLLRKTISRGGCVDFLLREIRQWIKNIKFDRCSEILVDIVSNQTMDMLTDRFMEDYDGRIAKAGDYRKPVLQGSLKADVWLCLDEKGSVLYLKILELATSPNVQDQESLHYLSPLVEVVLECARKTGKLDQVDCVLVCPIQLMEKSVIEDIAGLDEVAQNAVCSAVWHAINWIRAIINFYSDDTRTYHQAKVFQRLQNLAQLEAILLDELLDSCPHFGPPGMLLDDSIRRPAGKSTDSVKKKRGRPAKNTPPVDRRALVLGSFDGFHADVLKILSFPQLRRSISEGSAAASSSIGDNIRPHTLVETLVTTFEDFALEPQTLKKGSKASVFSRVFSERLGWRGNDATKASSDDRERTVLKSMCKFAHNFADVLQKISVDDDEGETDREMQESAERTVGAYLHIGSALFDTLVITSTSSNDAFCVKLCQDYFLPEEQHVELHQDIESNVRSQVLESCFMAAMRFATIVGDDTQMATTLLRTLLSIAGVSYGYPADQIPNRAANIQLKQETDASPGKDMSAKISSLALSCLQHDWSGGDKKFTYKSADLDVFLACYLKQGVVVLDNVQELAIDGILALTKHGGGGETATFPTLTKKTLATFHRAMFDALVLATVRLDFAASLSEGNVVLVLNYFTQAVLLFRILVGITKSYPKTRIVASVLKSGRKFVEIVVKAMPFFKDQFLDYNEQIMKIISEVQVATRRIQVLCAHGKLIKDGTAAAQVPTVKRLLERFIYKGEELARDHGVIAAFSTGVLKNKRIDGTTISKEELRMMEEEGSDSDSEHQSEAEEQESEGASDDEAATESQDEHDGEPSPPKKRK